METISIFETGTSQMGVGRAIAGRCIMQVVTVLASTHTNCVALKNVISVCS
jgi:hypothetical protein